MMKDLQVFLCATLVMATTAMAEEMTEIHVDLEALETSQDLSPVNGLTSSGQPDAEQFKGWPITISL